MEILSYILCCIVSVIITCIMVAYEHKNHSDGIFHVNTTDPNKDIYRLEMLIPLGLIPKRKVLYFKVVDEDKKQ